MSGALDGRSLPVSSPISELGLPLVSLAVVGAWGLTTAAMLPDLARMVAVVGTAVCLVGTVLPRRTVLAVGVVVLLGAIVLASEGWAATISIVLASLGAMLAWENGSYAVRLRREHDPGTSTARAEAVHAAWTAAVGILAIGTWRGVREGVELVPAIGRPSATVGAVALLVGVAAMAAFRRVY